MTTLLSYMGGEEWNEALAPTPLSKAAVLYVTERRRVADGANGPNWSAKTVDALKNACEIHKDRLDLLKMPEPKTRP